MTIAAELRDRIGDAEEMAAEAQRLHQAGQLPEAEAICRDILARLPGHAEALHRLGLILAGGGDTAGLALLVRAVEAAPPDRLGLFCSNFGAVLLQHGEPDRAVEILRRAVAAAPGYRRAYDNLIAALTASDRPEEAAAVVFTLANRLTNERAYEEAAVQAEAAAALDGSRAPYWRLMGNLHRTLGRRETALAAYGKAIALDPQNLGLQLGRAIARLPIINTDAADIEASRSAYAADVAELARLSQVAPPPLLAAASFQIGDSQPFYLSYQGRCDRDLQRHYGTFAAAAMAASLPDLPPLESSAPAAGRRLRIGFASAYFHNHSVSKLFRGWLEQLDRTRFEIVGYDLGAGGDAMAEAMAAACEIFRSKLGDTGTWANAILSDRLDVLIHLDVGMAPAAIRLAALRLAPVQCVAWGHPTTTGLPTIDYFLSSALMEPADGAEHYTEKMVPLPGLSIWYDSPPPPGPIVLTRADLGLREDAVVYVCCQSLFKYLPQHDGVFARIAARLPTAQFLFIAHPSAEVTGRFRRRLDTAFKARGLELEDRVVFADAVPQERFPDLLRAGDIYLDSIGWSGGNTTLEATAVDLPIVTLPTGLMRGRHSAAILARMGLRDTIAVGVEDYCDIATRLGTDPEARDAAAAAVAENKSKIYRDRQSIEGLERFLTWAVSRAAG
jgi:protein O-GlcNAc transferase